MNDAIITSSRDEANERLLSWCFDTRPQSADWDTVLARPEQLDLAQLTAEMCALGPEHDGESLDAALHVWRLQQRIRVAVRHQKHLPVASKFKCAQCGTHPADPVLVSCLHCSDIDQQLAHLGSRGNCHFLRPAHDPSNKCWALLSYRSFLSSDARAPILLYAASGYRDFAAAQDALLPLSNYARLTQRSSVHYVDIFSVFNYLDLVAANLPMPPMQWSEFSRQQILRHYAGHNPNSLDRLLSEAIGKIAAKDRTAQSSPDGDE